MRRVLIVSPHFPPTNAPDHQRVRMSLPYFQENGWEPVVLAVTADGVSARPRILCLPPRFRRMCPCTALARCPKP